MPLSQAERSRRSREKKKIAKYGESSRGVNMSGRHGNQAKGEKNGRWNSGRLISSHGYVLVRVPKDHHLAFGKGYAYEHDLVAEEKLGRRLWANEIAHHENEVKTDNRPENIVVKTASDHMREHYYQRSIDTRGRLLPRNLDLQIREYPQ